MAVISTQMLKCSDFGVWQRQLLFEAEECLYHISCRNGKRVLVTKCEASNPKNSSPRSKNSKPKQKKGTPTSKSSTSNSQKPSGDAVAKKKEQFLKEAKSNVAKLASIGRKQSEDPLLPEASFGVWLNHLSYAQAESYFHLSQKPEISSNVSPNVEPEISPIKQDPTKGDDLTEVPSNDHNQECNFADGVWLHQHAFLQAETRFYSRSDGKSRSQSRRRKKSPKPKPFSLTRNPPVAARFVEPGCIADNTDVWSQVLEAIKLTDQQTAKQTEFREKYVNLLNQMIAKQDEIFKEARLEIFGSTKNGFGHSNSDLDLVLTYPNTQNAMEIERTKTNADLVNLLAKILRRPEFFDIIRVMQVIRSARVPIIKFVSSSSKFPHLSGDICIRNCLGPRNTKLMKAYARYDERFRTLGYGIKKFAKLANINDASSGSLSSYAYLLMMIYYLQRTNPPILPCLQNVHLAMPGEYPVRVENEMNTWYQENLDYVKGVLGKTRNMESLGSLWKGFFRFYCEFSFRHQIDITMRAMPTVRKVAIEIRDPFDEDHDLARVLRLQGENLIRNCFTSALELFNRIEVLQPDLTDASKLAFFEWIVEQVENSHPYEKMTTCWTCGYGDHYRSVCDIYAQRRKAREIEEQEEAERGAREGAEEGTTANPEGDAADKAKKRRPNRRNHNDAGHRGENKEAVRGANMDKKGDRHKHNHLNPRNGMQFQTIPQANNRNTYQQVFNGHLTGAALQRFPLANIGNQVPMMPPYGHIQPHPYGQLGLLSNPPQAPQYRHQYGPRPRISHPYDNMSSAGYITPRFMTDPQYGSSPRYHMANSNRQFYTNGMMPDQRQQTYQNINTGVMPNTSNLPKERSYGRNKNKTFPEVLDPMSQHSKMNMSAPVPNLIDGQSGGESGSGRYPPRNMRMPSPQQNSNFRQTYAPQIPPESFGNQRNLKYF